jgi:hypothetical protein
LSPWGVLSNERKSRVKDGRQKGGGCPLNVPTERSWNSAGILRGPKSAGRAAPGRPCGKPLRQSRNINRMRRGAASKEGQDMLRQYGSERLGKVGVLVLHVADAPIDRPHRDALRRIEPTNQGFDPAGARLRKRRVKQAGQRQQRRQEQGAIVHKAVLSPHCR